MGSSNKIITGYNYWGSVAILVALGPVKRLHAIYNGDTAIWTGPIDSSSAEFDGRTTLNTELGVIDFYWGTTDQDVNPALDGLLIDMGTGPQVVPMPAYRRCSYIVAHDNSFGQQVTAPTYRFDFECERAQLDISAHDIAGDAVIPEVIYDYLTNGFYGAGRHPDLVDADSFSAAAEQTITEGLGASPDIDETDTVRETVGKLLGYIDGFLFWRSGKIHIGLVRQESIIGLEEISEADLLEEPRPLNETFETTWNQTLINFRDRENKWEESSEPYDDPANAALVGEIVQRAFEFPWVTRREVAKILAARIGIRGGVPAIFWELTLKPRWRSITPGQLLRLNYERFGIEDRVVRVKEVRRGSLHNPAVTLQVIEEPTRDSAADYLPPEDATSVPGIVDETGSGDFALQSTLPRLSWLPEPLKEGRPDGILVALHRPDAMTIRATVWWTWDPAQAAYRALRNSQTFFPAKGTLICWHRIREDHWLFRVEMDTPHDYAWLQNLAEEATELFCVAGQRLFKSVGAEKDEHQVMALWLQAVAGGRFELVNPTVIDIELSGEVFETDNLALETGGEDGSFPATHVYFGRREDFFMLPTDTLAFERLQGNSLQDTELARWIKVTVANHAETQSITDVDPVIYDRDDTTMSPDGTYSEEWGDRALTCYELFDVSVDQTPTEIEDIDLSLKAILGGTPTAEQTLLAEHIDGVLGAMIWTPHYHYNV